MTHCRNHSYFHADCYQCIEARNRQGVTISDDDSSDLLGTVIAAEVVSSAFSSDDTPSVDTSDTSSFSDSSSSDSSSSDSGFSGFDGGDSGGGGAGGDF